MKFHKSVVIDEAAVTHSPDSYVEALPPSPPTAILATPRRLYQAASMLDLSHRRDDDDDKETMHPSSTDAIE